MAITRIGQNLFFTQSAWHPPMTAPKPRPKSGVPPVKTKSDDSNGRKKVEDAAAFIKKKLDPGWFDTISNGDLKQITSKLNALKPAQRNQVISKLSDDTLYKWADEVGSPWLGTGLDGGQKLNLFKTLVPALNGANLVRLGKELTEADSGVANNEFIQSVAGRATPDALEAYKEALMSGPLSGGEFSDQSSMLFSDYGGLQAKMSNIIDGELGHRQLVELSNLLDAFSPEERTRQFFENDDTSFTPNNMSKLAERITDPASEIGLNKKEKQRLFDLLSASMTGKQVADMQTALTAHDFIRTMDTNARLARETGQAQPMNSTDELGKALENYTNKKSLEREVNDPTNFSWLPVFESEAQSLAKGVVPHIPQIKAKVPDAPVSSNGELFFQSFMKTSKANSHNVIDTKKTEYMNRMSSHPANPALEGIVKDYGLDLATRTVAQRSAAIVYNELDTGEGNGKQARDMKLFGDITTRQQKIKNTDYFSEQYSTEENDVSDAKWLVNKAAKHLDQYSREFGLPRPLLAGILASEVDFDTPMDIRNPDNAGFVNRTAFRAHGDSAAKSLVYLDSDKVKADLQDAKLDEMLDYLNSDSTKKYIESIRRDSFNASYEEFLQDEGPMSIKHASLITLNLAHQMWSEGKKIPESDTPANFGGFLKNMSASQMAAIYRGYRAGTEYTGGFRNYDPDLKLYKVPEGEKFASAVGDLRAAMGYQAYQSEPYFEYYLSLDRR